MHKPLAIILIAILLILSLKLVHVRVLAEKITIVLDRDRISPFKTLNIRVFTDVEGLMEVYIKYPKINYTLTIARRRVSKGWYLFNFQGDIIPGSYKVVVKVWSKRINLTGNVMFRLETDLYTNITLLFKENAELKITETFKISGVKVNRSIVEERIEVLRKLALKMIGIEEANVKANFKIHILKGDIICIEGYIKPYTAVKRLDASSGKITILNGAYKWNDIKINIIRVTLDFPFKLLKCSPKAQIQDKTLTWLNAYKSRCFNITYMYPVVVKIHGIPAFKRLNLTLISDHSRKVMQIRNSTTTLFLSPGVYKLRFPSVVYSEEGNVMYIANCSEVKVSSATKVNIAYTKYVRLTVSSSLIRVPLVINGVKLVTPKTLWLKEGSTVKIKVPKEIKAQVDMLYSFDKWLDNVKTNVRILKISKPMRLTALYVRYFRVVIEDKIIPLYKIFWVKEGEGLKLSVEEPEIVNEWRMLKFLFWSINGKIFKQTNVTIKVLSPLRIERIWLEYVAVRIVKCKTKVEVLNIKGAKQDLFWVTRGTILKIKLPKLSKPILLKPYITYYYTIKLTDVHVGYVREVKFEGGIYNVTVAAPLIIEVRKKTNINYPNIALTLICILALVAVCRTLRGAIRA